MRVYTVKFNMTSPSDNQRPVNRRLLLLPPIVFALGLLFLWPYLAAEHARLQLWEIPLIWFGEATAFVWYAAYCWSALKRPRVYNNVSEAAEEVRIDREFLAFLLMLAIGIGVDIAISMRSVYQEREGLERAVPVVAQVVDGKAHPDRDSFNYIFFCRFKDGNGDIFVVRFKPPGRDVPEKVQAALRAEKLPVDINLVYDPQWPLRCWIPSMAPNANRLYFISFCVILFQGILGYLFYVFRRQYPSANIPPVQTAPFLGACILMGMIAVCSLLRPNMF